jgi:tape measure domain-containing protein
MNLELPHEALSTLIDSNGEICLKWQDLNQLTEVHPKAIKALAETLGIASEDFIQAVKNGEVSFNKGSSQSMPTLSLKSRHDL